jgi:hypothetical protein
MQKRMNTLAFLYKKERDCIFLLAYLGIDAQDTSRKGLWKGKHGSGLMREGMFQWVPKKL